MQGVLTLLSLTIAPATFVIEAEIPISRDILYEWGISLHQGILLATPTIYKRFGTTWVRAAGLDLPYARLRNFRQNVRVYGDLALVVTGQDDLCHDILARVVSIFRQTQDSTWVKAGQFCTEDAGLWRHTSALSEGIIAIAKDFPCQEENQPCRDHPGVQFFREVNGTWMRNGSIEFPGLDQWPEAKLAFAGQSLVIGLGQSSVAGLPKSGAVYVSDKNHTGEVRPAVDKPGARFGSDVSAFGEEFVVASDFRACFSECPVWAVDVFTKEAGTWKLQQRMESKALRTASSETEVKVALGNNTLVVCAKYGSGYLSAVAHVFKRFSDTWQQVQNLSSSMFEEYISDFCHDVAVSGDRIAIAHEKQVTVFRDDGLPDWDSRAVRVTNFGPVAMWATMCLYSVLYFQVLS